MTIQEIIVLVIVFAVGVPSAWRNPTAGALVLCWIAGRFVYYATGDNLPVEYYLFPDLFVIAVIACKDEYCCLSPYGSDWHQIKCMWLERSPADRAVLLIFPAMWILYAVDIGAYEKWMALWALATLQFLFASAESLEIFFRSRRSTEAADLPEYPGDLLVACRSRGYG